MNKGKDAMEGIGEGRGGKGMELGLGMVGWAWCSG